MVENRLERPYTLLVGECLAEILVLPYFCGELVAVPVSLPRSQNQYSNPNRGGRKQRTRRSGWVLMKGWKKFKQLHVSLFQNNLNHGKSRLQQLYLLAKKLLNLWSTLFTSNLQVEIKKYWCFFFLNRSYSTISYSWEPLGAKTGGTPPILPQPLHELAADPRLELTELRQFKIPSLGKASHSGKYLLLKFDIFFNVPDNLGLFSFFSAGDSRDDLCVRGRMCPSLQAVLPRYFRLTIQSLDAEDWEITPAKPSSPYFPPHILRLIFSLPETRRRSAPPMPELFSLVWKDQWGRKVDRPSYRNG